MSGTAVPDGVLHVLSVYSCVAQLTRAPNPPVKRQLSFLNYWSRLYENWMVQSWDVGAKKTMTFFPGMFMDPTNQSQSCKYDYATLSIVPLCFVHCTLCGEIQDFAPTLSETLLSWHFSLVCLFMDPTNQSQSCKYDYWLCHTEHYAHPCSLQQW